MLTDTPPATVGTETVIGVAVPWRIAAPLAGAVIVTDNTAIDTVGDVDVAALL